MPNQPPRQSAGMKKKNWALAAALLCLIGLIYAITVMRMSA